MPKMALLILAEGAEEMEAVIAADVLRRYCTTTVSGCNPWYMVYTVYCLCFNALAEEVLM